MSCPDLTALNVDWPLLAEQKLCLLQVIDELERSSAREVESAQALTGILHLIDTLQDLAEEQGLWEYPEDA